MENIAVSHSDRPCDLKIILLGDSAVGKSKLIERFLMKDYVPQQLSTYALTLYRYNYKNQEDGKDYLIDFWDTAGQVF
jgi:Rab-like protein 2